MYTYQRTQNHIGSMNLIRKKIYYNSRKLDPMPQDKLSPRQDVLRYGEQNFFISPFVIKKGAKRKLVIY